MILVIDNYDSFTHNLIQYIRQVTEHEVIIKRNDHITIEQIEKLQPDYILLSPGPGNPTEAGICLKIVEYFHKTIPILGVCLGHQTIAQAFGGTVEKANHPMHGKISMIKHDEKGVFCKIASPMQVTRYHSLIVHKETLPRELEITALTEDGEIMAIRHKKFPVEGVQFHPEAILTELGMKMIDNFFNQHDRKDY
ncbi:aminodeoxychorismate/anthranilate synthase component II [Neobacillus sp. PS3-40]|uniref:anthranilate synthase component II n=1 Tax=Neobacillus sp. PS3-40 TaxID=3070679 RepID=UPI0027DF4CCF|nr:aminodeoxychorismate/anthranilate synthase component II [Neobacillus sp. PS3-40]WML42653.1 aminodeoxychorismate/anthranilate synthase component II [Neobacillus sp. PS3-40]